MACERAWMAIQNRSPCGKNRKISERETSAAIGKVFRTRSNTARSPWVSGARLLSHIASSKSRYWLSTGIFFDRFGGGGGWGIGNAKKEGRRSPIGPRSRGGAIRTPDLLNPIQARYRAALRPDNIKKYTESPPRCQVFHEALVHPQMWRGRAVQQQLWLFWISGGARRLDW